MDNNTMNEILIISDRKFKMEVVIDDAYIQEQLKANAAKIDTLKTSVRQYLKGYEAKPFAEIPSRELANIFFEWLYSFCEFVIDSVNGVARWESLSTLNHANKNGLLYSDLYDYNVFLAGVSLTENS